MTYITGGKQGKFRDDTSMFNGCRIIVGVGEGGRWGSPVLLPMIFEVSDALSVRNLEADISQLFSL
jgi:hypothetical protein